MKKILALILCAAMLFTFAGCAGDSNKPSSDTSAPKLEGVEAPVDILTKVWTATSEDQKFPIIGGDMGSEPGTVDMSNTDFLTSSLVCGEEAAAMVDGAAAMIHAMMANNFTAASYSLADGADIDGFILTMREALQNNQWICGFPEKIFIASVTNDYVVVAFGAMDLVDSFAANLKAAFDVTENIVDEPLV